MAGRRTQIANTDWSPTSSDVGKVLSCTAAGETEWATIVGGGGTPASTVVNELTFGQSAAVGTATNYAREDHTHGTPSLGTTGTTACAGNDARLSDARTPTAHTHGLADITDDGALAALNTVNTAQIDDGAVTPAKTSFSPTAPEAGKYLKATGAGTVAWDTVTGGSGLTYPQVLSAAFLQG